MARISFLSPEGVGGADFVPLGAPLPSRAHFAALSAVNGDFGGSGAPRATFSAAPARAPAKEGATSVPDPGSRGGAAAWMPSAQRPHGRRRRQAPA